MKKLSLFLAILYTFSLLSPFAVQAQAPGAANPGGSLGASGGGAVSLVGAKVDYTQMYRPAGGNMDAGTIHTKHPDWLCTPAGFKFKLLCGPATVSFEAMNAAFKQKFGKNMAVGGGYRTAEAQKGGGGTFATYDPNYAPPAHLWGTAIDFDTGVFKQGTAEHNWAVANGPKYGWFWPNWAKNGGGGKAGVKEDWHFNYYFIGHNPKSDELEDFKGFGPTGGGGSSTSNATACAVTKVGNPAGQPTLPPGCESSGSSDPSVNCKGVACALKYIVNPYNISDHFGGARNHKGIDLAGSPGTPIHAPDSGIATNVHGGCPAQGNINSNCGGGAGNYVFMRGDSGRTLKFMHMTKTPNVKVNQKIKLKDVLGQRGTSGSSTGNHLHFQIEKGGTAVNPETDLVGWPWTGGTQ